MYCTKHTKGHMFGTREDSNIGRMRGHKISISKICRHRTRGLLKFIFIVHKKPDQEISVDFNSLLTTSCINEKQTNPPFITCFLPSFLSRSSKKLFATKKWLTCYQGECGAHNVPDEWIPWESLWWHPITLCHWFQARAVTKTKYLRSKIQNVAVLAWPHPKIEL